MKTRLLAVASLSFVPLSLLAATPGTSSGSFAPGERVAPPAAHGPAAVSRTFVKTVTPLAGQVSADLPATGVGSLLVVALPVGLPGAALEGTLEGPSGRRLAAREGDAAGLRRFAISTEELGLDLPAPDGEVLHAAGAEAGSWRLTAPAPAGLAAVTVVAAEPDSPLVLSTWAAPLSRHAGEPILLHAELSDGGVPVTGARVVARLAGAGSPGGDEIPLYDDGSHGDDAAGDGVYAARFDAPGLPAGFVRVRFDADGRNVAGSLFARTGSGGLMNEETLATLGAVRARFSGDRVRVVAPVDVAVAGDYRLDAIVSGPALPDGSRQGLAWGEATVSLAKGPGRVVLEIPAAQIGGEGTVHVDVRLLGLSTIGLAGRVEVDADR